MRKNNKNIRNNRSSRNKRNIKQKKFINFLNFNKKTIKYFLIISFIFILIVLFFVIKNSSYISNSNINSINTINEEINIKENNSDKNLNKNNEINKETETNLDTTFTLTALGDVLCHNTQYWDAYNKDTDTYDFSYVFDDIKLYTQTGDLCIANLETSFAGKERGYSNYPTFNSPDNLAFSLKKIGVDIITTAGNHCLDMGLSGLSRTIDVLDEADISHLGTYKTQEERDSVFIKYVKGIKIAFVDYTYGTNGIPVPSDHPYCVNLIDKNLIKNDIEAAKKENPDMIIACMHWGTEYQTSANNEQKDLADFLFQNGVDVIIGNHPHVLQQMEKRTITLEDGTIKDGFVIYALGNFICDQNAENTRNSIILNLNITKHENGKITIDKADYIPIYMYKNTNVSIKKFKVLDIQKTIENYYSYVDTSIGESNYIYLQKQLEKIKQIVGEPF